MIETAREAWDCVFDEYRRVTGKEPLSDWYAYEAWVLQQRENERLDSAFKFLMTYQPEPED